MERRFCYKSFQNMSKLPRIDQIYSLIYDRRTESTRVNLICAPLNPGPGYVCSYLDEVRTFVPMVEVARRRAQNELVPPLPPHHPFASPRSLARPLSVARIIAAASCFACVFNPSSSALPQTAPSAKSLELLFLQCN